MEEQKIGESQIEQINEKIAQTKKIIDQERVKLEAERLKLKQINEVKDADYAKFAELKIRPVYEYLRFIGTMLAFRIFSLPLIHRLT